MIQSQTKIQIKDNSGFLLARCINSNKPRHNARIGDNVKVAIIKSRTIVSKNQLQKRDKKKALQDVFIIQTKKPLIRKDGSTLTFNKNGGVCINITNRKLQLQFKKINTYLPFELKKNSVLNKFKSAPNILKLAKNLI